MCLKDLPIEKNTRTGFEIITGLALQRPTASVGPGPQRVPSSSYVTYYFGYLSLVYYEENIY